MTKLSDFHKAAAMVLKEEKESSLCRRHIGHQHTESSRWSVSSQAQATTGQMQSAENGGASETKGDEGDTEAE